MQSPPKKIEYFLTVCMLMACAQIQNTYVYAQTPGNIVSSPSKPQPVNNNEIPDYGGRELIGNITDQSKTNAATPVEQSLRAIQSLVIVLCLIFGFLYFVKKFGLLQNNRLLGIPLPMAIAANNSGKNGSPIKSIGDLFKPQLRMANVEASGDILKLIDTCVLPGSGGILYVVDVAGRNFLVGALGNQISLLSEWSVETDVEEENEEVEAQESDEDRFERYLERVGVKEETQPDVISPKISETANRLEATLDRVRKSE